MSEYLRIRNFGPIEEIEINNIPSLTILIGESGSGKSTIMKVLSLCRWIYKRVVLRSYVKQANIKKTGIGIQMRTLLKTSQINEYLTPRTEILYRRGDYEIEYNNGRLNAQADIPETNLSLEKICYNVISPTNGQSSLTFWRTRSKKRTPTITCKTHWKTFCWQLTR